jgi:hypothetical protein
MSEPIQSSNGTLRYQKHAKTHLITELDFDQFDVRTRSEYTVPGIKHIQDISQTKQCTVYLYYVLSRLLFEIWLMQIRKIRIKQINVPSESSCSTGARKLRVRMRNLRCQGILLPSSQESYLRKRLRNIYNCKLRKGYAKLRGTLKKKLRICVKFVTPCALRNLRTLCETVPRTLKCVMWSNQFYYIKLNLYIKYNASKSVSRLAS